MSFVKIIRKKIGHVFLACGEDGQTDELHLWNVDEGRTDEVGQGCFAASRLPRIKQGPPAEF